MIVSLETHGPCHRPCFDVLASLLFEERPRGVEVGVSLVATRTPEHVAVPFRFLAFTTYRTLCCRVCFRLHFDPDTVLLGGCGEPVDERAIRPELTRFLVHHHRPVFREDISEVAHVDSRHAFLVQALHQVSDECVLCVVAAARSLTIQASNPPTAVPSLTEFGLQASDLLGGFAEPGEQVPAIVEVLLAGRSRTGDEVVQVLAHRDFEATPLAGFEGVLVVADVRPQLTPVVLADGWASARCPVTAGAPGAGSG